MNDDDDGECVLWHTYLRVKVNVFKHDLWSGEVVYVKKKKNENNTKQYLMVFFSVYLLSCLLVRRSW